MKRMLDILILAMFVMILFFVITFVCAAFVNHVTTVRTSQDAFDDLKQTLAKDGDKDGTTNLRRVSREDYLAQLKLAQKELFDTNTVSFLFQVLLLCLITIGAYLLERTHAGLKTAEMLTDHATKRISCIKPFLRSVSAAQVLSSHYAVVHECAATIRGASVDVQGTLFPIMRDSFKQIKKHILEMREQQYGIEPSLYDSFILNAAEKTNQLLKPLATPQADGNESDAAVLFATSQECLEYLTTAQFKERYQKLLDDLGPDIA